MCSEVGSNYGCLFTLPYIDWGELWQEQQEQKQGAGMVPHGEDQGENAGRSSQPAAALARECFGLRIV